MDKKLEGMTKEEVIEAIVEGLTFIPEERRRPMTLAILEMIATI